MAGKLKMRLRKNVGIILVTLLMVLVLDGATKNMAVEHLTAGHVPREVWGEVVRFTLIYNTGAAMGLPLGPYSRPIVVVASLVVIGVLLNIARKSPTSGKTFYVALGLLLGGAVGNLIDRIFSPRGVVDFIDIGIGAVRFWTFNVADIGITCGALFLAVVLWREEKQTARENLQEQNGSNP